MKKFGLGHTTSCVYQCIDDDMEEKDNILHFLFLLLGLFIGIKSYVAHILYERKMSNNTEIPFLYKNEKYFYLVNKRQHYLI